MRDPLGPPPPSRHPDTVFLLALCLTAGLSQTLGPTEPGSVTALVPPWLADAWGVLLTVGAVITLTGVFWRHQVTGLLIEAVGRTMFAPAALAYAVAIAAAAGTDGALAAAPFVGFAASCGWRIRQILRSVTEVRAVLHTMTDAARDRDRP